MGSYLWLNASGVWWASLSTVQLLLVCGDREAMVVVPTPTQAQQHRLASMATWLSTTGICHHNLPCHIPLIHPSRVNSSPYPGIAPQSPNSSSQPLHLLGDLRPCLAYVWLRQELSDFISFKLPQMSYFTLSIKHLSSDSDNCLDVEIGPLLLVPLPPRAGPVLWTLLFPTPTPRQVPSS